MALRFVTPVQEIEFPLKTKRNANVKLDILIKLEFVKNVVMDANNVSLKLNAQNVLTKLIQMEMEHAFVLLVIILPTLGTMLFVNFVMQTVEDVQTLPQIAQNVRMVLSQSVIDVNVLQDITQL